jgi:hypothetical protein
MIDPDMQSLIDEGNKLMKNYIVITDAPERTKPAGADGKPAGNITGVTVKAGTKFTSSKVTRGWIEWIPNRWILEADCKIDFDNPIPEPPKPMAIIMIDGVTKIFDLVEHKAP